MCDPIIGEIRVFTFTFTPQGWLPCDGSIYPISMYQSLYATIGNLYGGDGQTTFAVPDLRTRVALGSGEAAGMSFQLAQTGGEESVTLTGNTIPSHTHTVNGVIISPASKVGEPNNNYLSGAAVIKSSNSTETCASYSNNQPNTHMSSSTISPLTGKGAPHENRQPFMCLMHFIAWEGIFCPRPD